jgi:2-oxoglutarate dehydrogenase E2 component (dihydrolipoamide succinyltransferase)
MSIEVKVPVLPESVSDAVIATWHKQPGDSVRRDENLVDLETDKVVLEVPSPVDGVLKEIKFQSGATVTSQQIIAVIEEGAAAAAAAPAAAAPAKTEAPKAAAPAAAPAPVAAAKVDTSALSPAGRFVAESNQINPADVAGTGRRGQVTKEDLVNHMRSGGNTKAGARAEERVPMTRIRQRIAERLVRAQQTAAILTTFNEIDMSAVLELRARWKDAFEKRHGVKLGFMSLFGRACVHALHEIPELNAEIRGTDIVYRDHVHLGVAVGTERGLVVPVVKDAGRMGLADLERAIGALAAKARDNALSLDDLSGGTFTISNGGVYGSLLSTPILNPPQSGILGMHKIEKRPIAVDDQVVIRPMMYVALSYDHRIVDGEQAVTFLVRVKERLEAPERMLLDV